jgi:para-aminobenzoate synthetase component 1
VPGGGPARPLVTGLASDFTAPGYRAAVEKVRDYIARGDVYQVNLSQMFRGRFDGDPWLLWQALFRRNPAPFYAYVEAGDHQVASTSMERFLALRDGVLEARPIKGTRPRGRTAAEDEALAAELRASPKDDAELSMIVDLLRNDLGRVCATGSVAVREHKRLESYANVHHLVSVVQGRLRPGATVGDILRAAFPCGSITGCPKIRAMEVIDELEPHRRHVYTGSIGYLGWHGTLDLNVAIRTAEVHRGRCSFAVGGGIVYDSHPADEFEETLDKGRTFFAVAGEEGA